jgi:hypothetical protein
MSNHDKLLDRITVYSNMGFDPESARYLAKLVDRIADYINMGFDLESARYLARCDLNLTYAEDCGLQKDTDESRETSGGPGA